MTIVAAGRNRTAILASSTWTQMKLGVGTATVSVGDQDLETSLFIKTIGTITVTANVVNFKTTYTKSDVSSASNVTEIGVFDGTTTFILFRTVASTNTWTSFLKNSTNVATISTSLTVSS